MKEILKSVNIWKSYKEERGCLMHFARLANTLLKDEKSARDNHCKCTKESSGEFKKIIKIWQKEMSL